MLVLYIGLRAKIVFEFENFLSNFEKVLIDKTLCNSLFTIILGDFNARTSVWWTRDKASVEGTHLNPLYKCVWVSSTNITMHSSTTTNLFLY